VMQLLIQQGYIQESRQKMKHDHITVSSYKLSIAGQSALDDTSRPILLPVTEAIQTREQQERAQRLTMIQQLQQNGINLQQIRAMEEQYSGAVAGSSSCSNTASNLEDGVLLIYAKWSQYVSSMQQNSAQLDAIESLIQVLEQWRTETAAKCRSKIFIHLHNTMDTTVTSSSSSPLAVLTGHHLILIAYTVATMIPGNRVNSNKQKNGYPTFIGRSGKFEYINVTIVRVSETNYRINLITK
jgi:DNA-binding transcriptional MerR regulator